MMTGDTGLREIFALFCYLELFYGNGAASYDFNDFGTRLYFSPVCGRLEEPFGKPYPTI